MTLRIIAIADEPIYPQGYLPRTLIDIVEVIGKSGCEICLLQPGSKDLENNEELFRVITFSRMPRQFKGFFKILEHYSEPSFKAVVSSFNPRIYQILFGLAQSSDVLMCYCIQHSIPALVTGILSRKPVILLGDPLYIGYYRNVRKVSPFLLLMLLVWEKSIQNLVDKIVVWGPDDKKFLVSSGISKDKIIVVPLSINLEKIKVLLKRENEDASFYKIKAFKDKGLKILMFHGNLNSGPNQACVNYIINDLAPSLIEKHPDVVFVIVGANSVNNAKMPPRIILTGYVQNLYSYINLADIGIVPLISGSGVKNKILDYFVLSKPVVTTKIGAENIGAKNMVNCIVTSIQDFPNSISLLLDDPKLMTTLGVNAKQYVEQNHSFNNYNLFVDLLKDLSKRK